MLHTSWKFWCWKCRQREVAIWRLRSGLSSQEGGLRSTKVVGSNNYKSTAKETRENFCYYFNTTYGDAPWQATWQKKSTYTFLIEKIFLRRNCCENLRYFYNIAVFTKEYLSDSGKKLSRLGLLVTDLLKHDYAVPARCCDYIETSLLIWSSNQLTGFVIIV